MEPVARLEHVTYTYPERQAPALRDATLALRPAEVVLVIGGSGSGKSTLLRALCGLVPHFHGGTFAGHAVVADHDTRTTDPRDLAEHVGMVFQDPENQAVMVSVERELAFGLENLGLAGPAISRLVEESLLSLGLSRLRHAELATLSGGELQKVALAAVLAMQPQLLLLDEPTSQLDPVSSEDLLAAVRRLSEDTGSTIVLAEHRVERCLYLATRVLYMEDGAILQDTDPQSFAAWAARRRRELLPPVARLFAGRLNRAASAEDLLELPMTVKDARRRLALAGSDVLASAADRKPGPIASATATMEGASPSSRGMFRRRPTAAVEVRRLTAGYPPDRPVLDEVDLALWPGDLVAIMGENGAGKSTLVRHFNGMARPLTGKVLLTGTEVTSMSVAEAARTCAFLGQNPGAYFVRDSVADELDFSFSTLGIPPAEAEATRSMLVSDLDLGALLDRDPRDLSGGERTRVALAIVSCGDPAVVVLDEPTRGMDPAHKNDLAALLRRWAGAGRCVVVVTHDVEFAARTADRVVVLGDGGILADAPVREALHGSLFFSTQINRLLRRELPGALTEDDVVWTAL
jgi:energy-coupling factor transport system ATP-binding protein